MATTMRRERAADVEKLRLLGGRLCLDYANTIDPRDGPDPVDYFETYGDVVRWCVRLGLAENDEARELLELRSREPAAAMRAHRRAVDLRETIFGIFLSLARGGEPGERELARLEGYARATLGRARLARTGARFAWSPSERRRESLDAVLDPVVLSALGLLAGRDVERVKECAASGDCGWLFVDESPGGTRRWCRMGGCGSRAKSRRYYARRVAARTG